MTHWERMIVCKYVFSVAASLCRPPSSTLPLFCWSLPISAVPLVGDGGHVYGVICALKKRLAPGSLLACNAGSHSLIPSSTICIHNVLFLEGLEIELSRQTVCSLFFVCLLFFTFLPVSPGADVEWIVWAVYIMKLGLLMWDCCLALHSSEREHWRWWVPLEFLHSVTLCLLWSCVLGWSRLWNVVIC